MKGRAKSRTKVVIVTRIGGKDLFEEEYYIEETAPFKDVVDAHHEMRKAEPNTFAYRMVINGRVVKIDSSDNYMATTRALRIGDNARIIAYKQRQIENKPSPPQSRSSSSSDRHRRQRGGEKKEQKKRRPSKASRSKK